MDRQQTANNGNSSHDHLYEAS